MYWRRIAVVLGSLVLGIGVGAVIAHTPDAATYGLAAGLGLGLILVAFVRD